MIVVANRPQHLHLVAGAFTTPVAQAEPKVFTVDFRQRLALLTHAERELRALGYPVVWSRLAGPMPQLHIQRDAAVSIVPLLDRATPRSFRTRVEDDHTLASCEFAGVLVSWVRCKP